MRFENQAAASGIRSRGSFFAKFLGAQKGAVTRRLNHDLTIQQIRNCCCNDHRDRLLVHNTCQRTATTSFDSRKHDSRAGFTDQADGQSVQSGSNPAGPSRGARRS